MTVTPEMQALLTKLKIEYPDKATVLENTDNIFRERYLSKLELINYIELLITGKDK